MTAPAAGWFPDPAGRPGVHRWWDGSAWTRVLTDDPSSPAVDFDGATPAAMSAADGDHVRSAEITADGSPVPVIPSPAGENRRRVYPPGYEPAVRRARRSARARAVVSMLVAVVIAAVVVLVVINERTSSADLLQPPPRPTGPAAKPTAQPDDLSYDELTRAVSLTGMKVTMPAAPYTADESSLPVVVLEEGVQAVATVQKDYNGTSDWVAVVGVGHVPVAAAGKDLASTADGLLDRFVKAEFSGKVTVKNTTRKTYTDYPRPVRIINADVHYKVKGVSSTYDRVSMLVTRGAGDGYIAWISSRPDKANAKVRKALQDSIGSIQILK